MSAASTPLGIPRAPFSENVSELIAPGETPDTAMEKFEELLNKYRMMEFSLNAKRGRLQTKREDLVKSVEAVKGLRANPSAVFRYEMNDTLYGSARLAKQAALDEVHLWLGANVMLSYPTDEAIALLTTKLEEAELMLTQCEKDLFFVRDQITTTEVNTARAYNHFMSLRK